MLTETIFKTYTKIRTEIHKLLNHKLYSNKVILFGVPHLVHRENIQIGDNTRINPNVTLYGHGGINLGENVTLSHGVSIFSTGYQTKNWRNNKVEKMHENQPVNISDNVWLGANAIILKNVFIEEGCIIAAGSVVTHDLLEKNAIYGGNPAEFIKKLD